MIFCCHNYAQSCYSDCNAGPRPLTLEVGDNSLVVLRNPQCHGTESKLVECNDDEDNRCQNNQTAGIICRAGNILITVFQSLCIPEIILLLLVSLQALTAMILILD